MNQRSFAILLALLVATGFVWAENPLKPPRNGGVYVIAHRGAHQGPPENSLPAYQKAIDLGCDFVEVDVNQVDATFMDGILTMTFPKPEEKKPKSISVKVKK